MLSEPFATCTETGQRLIEADAAMSPRGGLNLDPAGRDDQAHVGRGRSDEFHSAGQACPTAILAYVGLDYAARLSGSGPGSIAVSRLASVPDGPGRLLLTNTEGLQCALRSVAARHAGLGDCGFGARRGAACLLGTTVRSRRRDPGGRLPAGRCAGPCRLVSGRPVKCEWGRLWPAWPPGCAREAKQANANG